jgi:hypothetical protein
MIMESFAESQKNYMSNKYYTGRYYQERQALKEAIRREDAASIGMFVIALGFIIGKLIIK